MKISKKKIKKLRMIVKQLHEAQFLAKRIEGILNYSADILSLTTDKIEDD